MAAGVVFPRFGRFETRLLALSFLTVTHAVINNDAAAFEIKFNDSTSVGPDGPWNFILQIDQANNQYIASLPSVAKTSLVINESTCDMLGAACPHPAENMWHAYSDWKDANGTDTKSYLMPPSDWDEDYTALLNMTGAGGFFTDKVVLNNAVRSQPSAQLENQGLAISKDWTVNFASKTYTKGVGLFSLDGASNNLTYGNNQDQTVVANTTLISAYELGYIPSVSYGLHIGSAEPNITGSLVLGGYDKSRILSDAIVAGNDNVFRLTDIGINVTTGGSAFTKSPSDQNGLLKTPGYKGDYVEVHPRPGLPYIYLPRETCDAIAEYIPVTYSADYNLYLWDTADPAYEAIVSSPHYLSFIFTDDTKTSAHINVPFALLNLTLDYPLAKDPTQYFPCSPWEPRRTGYTLGNAFLQAAFLSQHWQMNTTVLAQAPGPDYHESNIQAIPYDSDVTVGAAKDAALWATTWEKTLSPLPGESSSGSTSDSTSGSTSAAVSGDDSQSDKSTNGDSTSPSGGAIAGIVIGVVAGIAIIGLLIWFLLRRRKNKNKTEERLSSSGVSLQNNSPPPELEAAPMDQERKPAHEVETKSWTELPSHQKVELPAQQRAYELAGDGGMIAEKPAN